MNESRGGRLIDISMTLRPDMPTWPGSAGFARTVTMSMAEGGEANVSKIESDLHMGTHVDAPVHFVPGARTVEDLALDALIGPAVVVDVGNAAAIGPDEVAAAPPADRILFRTTNSQRHAAGNGEFFEDFVAITADGARALVDRGVRLVGVDYLSVQRYADPTDTHCILLGAEVVAVEGLDLSRVAAGTYELLCLPLKIEGADGALARAVLRELSGGPEAT